MITLKKFLLIFLNCILLTATMPCMATANSVNGLKYQKYETPWRQIIHVLDIDPSMVRIIIVPAHGAAFGRQTVEQIAKDNQAVAAINGGFFKMDSANNGLPAGILKINHQWYGIAYRPRAALAWTSHEQKAMFDRVQTKTTLYLNHLQYPVHALNQPPGRSRAILYNAAYGKKTSPVAEGYDVVIENNQIVNILPAGNTVIPTNGYIYSIGPDVHCPKTTLSIGQKVHIRIQTLPQLQADHQVTWQAADNIIGGTPLLLKDGQQVTDYATEQVRKSFINQRHARTAVGTLKNGHWVWVVVEQNTLDKTPGMTIYELTHFMQKLGCLNALNLDGGGSSTLYFNNKILNHPEGDEDEDKGTRAIRSVSEAILILPK